MVLKVARKSLATLLSALLAFQPMLVEAQQVTPDTSAPAANQPGIGAAPNGVPLIDIVTPNRQGLSHNKYGDFNVGNPGLILNNSNKEVDTSKLGGVTPGNPNLRNSAPASVILNEVTSGKRSALEGPVEVFGGRADVVIANPNGITCDGCGFINTPRATLTTGTPDVDASGRLSGFTVNGGDVTFGSRGGNFASGDGAVDLFDIVSRNVSIDGPVAGKNLRLTAGRNKFDYASGEATALPGADDAPEFAIDGSALGAMQADRIKIVVTDKGAGVRMRADMAANAGELTLSSDGKISLGNASGRDGVNIQSKSREVEAKKITAKKRVTVKADKGVTLEAVAADEDVVVASGTGLLSIAGEAASLGTVELTSSGAISTGNVSAGKNATLDAGQGISAGQVVGNGAASLKATSGNIALSGAAKAGGGDLTVEAASGAITAASLISFNNMTLTAGADIGVTGDMLAGGKLVADAASIKIGNAVAGVDASATARSGKVVLGNAGDLALTAHAGSINAGTLLSAGDIAATSTRDVTANAVAHGAMTMNAGGTITLTGQSLAGSDVALKASSLQLGTLVSGVDFAATEQSGGSLILKTGSGKMALNATGGSIVADQLVSGGELAAHALRDITYNSLQSFAGADLHADQGSISLDHSTVAKGGITLTLQSLDLSNGRSKLATAGMLTVNAADANLANSTLTFGGISLNLTGTADLSGSKVQAVTADGGTGNIAISGQTITTNPATALLAAGDLTLTLASLTNAGQLAANGNLTFNITGKLTNAPTGLVYAGQDGLFYIAGDLVNDQGAIITGRDLTIAADASGGRNQSITNTSGLIKAGRDATITTANLVNERASAPTWSDVVVSDNETTKFELNPETWGKPLGHLFIRPDSYVPFNLYPGEDPAGIEWMAELYGVITFADGTSYRTRSLAAYEENTPWKWGSNRDGVGSMSDFLRDHYPTDANGNIILTPDLQPKAILIVNKAQPFAWSFTWDENTRMRQTIHEQRFNGDLSPQALIQTGRDLNIDATTLDNAYSAIEAGGSAKLTGTTLNNQGVALYRTVTSTCEAKGGCEAYDANGNRDSVNDLDRGNSRVTSQEVVDGAFGTIKAAGNLDVSGFATVNNTSSAGSIAGGGQLSTAPTVSDPTKALDGLTAGGALFTPNPALGQINADNLAPPKPNSGGFGGTIPGQTFLYETRAEFLDVGKFYGSGYFIDRIGYKPDRQVPFLGDAYFENQLVDQQLRQLINQGLGSGSFIPGSDAIEQMKVLLDRGADFAREHGLTIGEKLSPELINNLTETIVWYEKKTVNGVEVLVPTVYVANTDRANLTVAGAIISGGSLNMDVGDVNNSGIIAAKTDLKIAATNISATGGSFNAGGNTALSATQNLTIAAGTMQIGGETFVKAGSGVTAGGNADLSAGNALTLRGADIKADGNVSLTGENVTLDTARATNNGSDNVIGTTVQSGGGTTIKATDSVNVIGSDVAAGGTLDVEAENGSVNVVAADVEKKVNGVAGTRMSQTDSTFAKQSTLSSRGDTNIKAGDDILISGSKVEAEGNVALVAKDDINITTAREKTETIGREVKQGSETHVGSQITAGGSVSIAAGDKPDAGDPHDLNIIGSEISAGGKVGLSATDDVTIAEARDTGYHQLDTRSKRFIGSKETHSRTETETAVGSSISGAAGVDIVSGQDTTISASKVQAGDKDHKADLNVTTGGDLVIASGKNTVETDASKSKSGFLSKESGKSHDYDETTVASELGASGNVNLNAGDNVAIAGSKVNAGEAINIEGDSIAIIGAQEEHDSSSSSKKSGFGVGSGGGFYSLYGKESKSSKENIVSNVGSELSAGTDVNVKAREGDVSIVGSDIQADRDIALDAARDVNITPGAESYQSEEKEKRSGFGVQLGSGNGSASIGIGFGSSKDETREGAETNAVSSLAAGRDVKINAGRDANLQAAQVEAERDVAIVAERDVNLLSAQDVSNYEHMHEELFAGITAQVSTGIVGAGQSIADAANKIGKVSDGYSAANAGFAGLKAYDALKDLQAMANGTGNLASASLSVGFQYSKSKETAESSVPVVTGIRGGNSVTIDAVTGDINSHGAQIIAGVDANGLPSGGAGDISLSAGDDINLESAQATNSSSSSSKSAGASIGVSAGLSLNGVGLGLSGNVNAGMGKSNSEGTTQVNTHVTGTGDVKLNSGGDTNLKGAVVSGDTVTANVGGDLNIISVPDTGTSKNQSASFGIGFGGAFNPGDALAPQIGNMGATGVSPGFGTGSGTNNWISEQSGLISSGKMDVVVNGNTHLDAGKIISESGDLTLDTGTLTHEDFSGSKQYEGFDVTTNIDLTGKAPQQPDATTQPRVTAEGSYQLDDTRQEVRATVGEGTIIIRDKDKQAELEASGKTEDLAALNRDPDKAYEITKDKHVEIEYYFSDTSIEKALEAGKAITDIIVDAFGRMANDGKLGPQDYDSAVKLAKYKDDPDVIAQLNECGQRQGFNSFNPLDWLITPAYAQGGVCLIKTPGGTFPISPIGAMTCAAAFGTLVTEAAIIGLAATPILLMSTVPAGGGKIDETQTMDDGTIVHLTGNGSELSRRADLTMADGTKATLDFMLDPNTGQLILTGGSIDGKPMSRPSLQNVKYAMQSGGMKNIVLSQNAGMGHNGGPPLNGGGSSNSGGSGNGGNGQPPLLPPAVPGMNIDYDKISTAKPGQATAPRNLEEQVLWNQVLANPGAGQPLGGLNNDPRFPTQNGWQKMEITHRRPDGSPISIHYQYNSITGRAYDMKLTTP
jgi:filamentous hemagglutinin